MSSRLVAINNFKEVMDGCYLHGHLDKLKHVSHGKVQTAKQQE